MFIAYIYYHKHSSNNRKIEPVFNSDFVLNLITKRMSDEEVDALQKGVWLCETERVLKDKNGDPFRICKPVRFLGDNHEMFRYDYVHEALAFAFGEDAEAERRRFGEEVQTMLGHRISQQVDCGDKSVWNWVKEQFETGAASLAMLGQWVAVPVPVDWNKAKLIPATTNLRSGGVDSVFFFRDLNSCENEALGIRAYNLDEYRSVIPEYTQIVKVGSHQMKLEILLDKMISIVYDEKDPVYGDVLAQFQQTGAFWLTAAPYVDRPGSTFKVGVEKGSVNFPTILKTYGIAEINGQYVPENAPDWTLKKIEGYRPEDGVCEVTSPQTCTIQVAFPNGMSGRYPLIYMMKRYPGKCLNASFAAKGYSLDSMRVVVSLSDKE